MDWDKEPDLQEFHRAFQVHTEEVMWLGQAEGHIHSHKIKGRVHVISEDPDDDTAYEIVGLELDQLMGCGCACGVTIKIRKVKE